jgi:Domain of unknown function (DUF4184)
MPFTFSHPAIVLPLGYISKRWISMTGLVVGSLSPDFEYFLRLNVTSYYSHTWKGMFWFDLPLAIILAFIFHLIVRDKLIDNLPAFLTKRLLIFKQFNWIKYFKENYLAVVISIIIGTASHIFWDSFTHKDGLFVQKIAVLRSAFIIEGYSLPFYKLAQHLSTIIGGLTILLVLLQLPKDNNFKRQKPIFPFWLFVSFIALIIIAIKFLIGHGNTSYADLLITAITGVLTGIILASLNLKMRYNSE